MGCGVFLTRPSHILPRGSSCTTSTIAGFSSEIYIADRGSPLYYASLCGFRDLAAHIIVEHPEQVNARGGRNHSPLAAALHKRHFDVAELLHQHGAAVDVPWRYDQTPLQLHRWMDLSMSRGGYSTTAQMRIRNERSLDSN
jgi:hypothetical protein